MWRTSVRQAIFTQNSRIKRRWSNLPRGFVHTFRIVQEKEIRIRLKNSIYFVKCNWHTRTFPAGLKHVDRTRWTINLIFCNGLTRHRRKIEKLHVRSVKIKLENGFWCSMCSLVGTQLNFQLYRKNNLLPELFNSTCEHITKS
jgi:hypothetical protein